MYKKIGESLLAQAPQRSVIQRGSSPTGGQVQNRCVSPYASSIRPTVGQNLVSGCTKLCVMYKQVKESDA